MQQSYGCKYLLYNNQIITMQPQNQHITYKKRKDKKIREKKEED
jgi:hypothetical protein